MQRQPAARRHPAHLDGPADRRGRPPRRASRIAQPRRPTQACPRRARWRSPRPRPVRCRSGRSRRRRSSGAGWRYAVDPGDAEEGYAGNGTPTLARTPRRSCRPRCPSAAPAYGDAGRRTTRSRSTTPARGEGDRRARQLRRRRSAPAFYGRAANLAGCRGSRGSAGIGPLVTVVSRPARDASPRPHAHLRPLARARGARRHHRRAARRAGHATRCSPHPDPPTRPAAARMTTQDTSREAHTDVATALLPPPGGPDRRRARRRRACPGIDHDSHPDSDPDAVRQRRRRRRHQSPVANPDTATVVAGRSIVIDVLTNDTDPDDAHARSAVTDAAGRTTYVHPTDQLPRDDRRRGHDGDVHLHRRRTATRTRPPAPSRSPVTTPRRCSARLSIGVTFAVRRAGVPLLAARHRRPRTSPGPARTSRQRRVDGRWKTFKTDQVGSLGALRPCRSPAPADDLPFRAVTTWTTSARPSSGPLSRTAVARPRGPRLRAPDASRRALSYRSGCPVGPSRPADASGSTGSPTRTSSRAARWSCGPRPCPTSCEVFRRRSRSGSRCGR